MHSSKFSPRFAVGNASRLAIYRFRAIKMAKAASCGSCPCISHCYQRYCPCLADGGKCSSQCKCPGRFCGRMQAFPEFNDENPVHTDQQPPIHVFAHPTVDPSTQMEFANEDQDLDATTPMIQDHDGIRGPPSPQSVASGISGRRLHISALPMNEPHVRSAEALSAILHSMRSHEVIDFFASKGLTFTEDIRVQLLSWIDEKERRTEPDLTERPDGCICRQCVATGHEYEDTCCNQDPCITKDPYFINVVTNPEAIRMAMAIRNDLWGTDDRGTSNRSYRYHAYRGFVLWQYGVLGKDDRRPLPCCAYKVIRRLFPKDPGEEEWTHFKSRSALLTLTHMTGHCQKIAWKQGRKSRRSRK